MTDGRDRGLQLRSMIFSAYEAARESRRPNRIRPSTLGHPCTRAGWYAFRWAAQLEQHEGRVLRLFETGHSQEDRLLNDLRRVQANVVTRNPDNPKEQLAVVDLDGHLKGFLDGVASDIPLALAEWEPVECK